MIISSFNNSINNNIYYIWNSVHKRLSFAQTLWWWACNFFFKYSAILSMNSSLLRYLSLETSAELWTINAKSFVMKPASIVSMHASSNDWAKCFNSGLVSKLAPANKPLVQAKILATEFVEVSLPYWCIL